jgi:D-xylose transport system permease protein
MMGLLGGVAAIFDVWLGWPLPLTVAVTLVWVWCWGLERLVGCLPQSPVVYCHPGGDAGLPGILIGITNGTTVSPTSAAMSQIGQSYLSDGVGFTIGVVGLLAFVAWQWRGRMRRQALGLASASIDIGCRASGADCGDCAGRHLASERLSRRTDPGVAAGTSAAGGMFMATRTAFGRRIYAIGGNLEAARLSGLTSNALSLPSLPSTA